MKKIFFIALLSFNAYAEDVIKEIWHIKNDHYLLANNSKTSLIISEYCLHEKKKCQALEAFERKDKIKLPPGSVNGGKNPAAVICTKGLNQKIIILKNSKEDEGSFCLFEDGSIISTSSLFKLI